MLNTSRVAKLVLATFILGAAASLPGCGRSRTTYSHTCRDGFVSRSTDREDALRGCDAHGGALSPNPDIDTDRSRTSSRRYKSSYKSKSSSRKKK